MRKRMWIMVLLLFALMVSGCNRNIPGDAEENSSEQNNVKEENAEESHQMSSESITALHRNINATIRQVGPEGNMAVTNLGMYYVEQIILGDGNYAFKMMYFDSATGENVVVCSNASCLHQDSSCEAIYKPELIQETEDRILTNNIKVSPLGVYEDKLYVMVSEKVDSMICLYASELSGHNRELLWKVSYPGENVEHRMITTDSVIWNGSRVYVNYFSEDHIPKVQKVLDEEAQTYFDLYANYIANLESGILCIDLSDTKGPVRVCEEGAEFFFEEKDTGELEMYALDRGYVVMMAAQDGVVYYRHLHTDEVLDPEAYMADTSSYKTNWNSTFAMKVMQADVQQRQVLAREIFELDGGITEYYKGNIYYASQDQVWKYDLTTNQREVVTALWEGAALECVTGGYLVLRNYTEQQMFFVNLDTKDVVTKEAALGSNLYGQVTFDDGEYWFFRSMGWDSDGERKTQWFLTTPQEYLTQEDYPRILVYQRTSGE